MKIDLTYPLTKDWLEKFRPNAKDKGLMSLGHVGTHFDVIGKTFPLDYSQCRGIIFDVSNIEDRDIEVSDINDDEICAGDFVLFRTGTSERYEYGTDDYSKYFLQISWELIKILVEKKVHIIGVDSRGLRKGSEHPQADTFCAENDTFVVENLINLDKIILAGGKIFKVHTYPLNLVGFDGIPCRVVAEI